MAKKRMLSLDIIDTDLFLEMPTTARLLYYEFAIRADDDGFVSSPKKIQRMVGCADDDFKLLIAKGYIIPFKSGICVITHWRIHNYIPKDRYKQTIYIDEKSTLSIDNSGIYSLLSNDMYTSCMTNCIQDVNKLDTQNNINKTKVNKGNIYISASAPKIKKHQYGEYKNVLLSDDELDKLKAKFSDYQKKIETLSTGIALKGYKYKSHYLAILKWANNEKDKEPNYSDVSRYDSEEW